MDLDLAKVWVPRTVPYRKMWDVARDLDFLEPDQVLRYRGKCEAELIGFARDCPCEEACERRWRDDEGTGDPVEVDRTCVVPAWAFEIVERGEP